MMTFSSDDGCIQLAFNRLIEYILSQWKVFWINWQNAHCKYRETPSKWDYALFFNKLTHKKEHRIVGDFNSSTSNAIKIKRYHFVLARDNILFSIELNLFTINTYKMFEKMWSPATASWHLKIQMELSIFCVTLFCACAYRNISLNVIVRIQSSLSQFVYCPRISKQKLKHNQIFG